MTTEEIVIENSVNESIQGGEEEEQEELDQDEETNQQPALQQQLVQKDDAAQETTSRDAQDSGPDGGGDDDTNSTCTICMEEWTIGTEHRICSLKCGHLYGRSCIERWIKEKGATQAKCPSCNKPTKRSDLRDLWCKAIRATDTTEISALQQMLESERKLRKTDAAVIFHQNLKLEMLHEDLSKLKKSVIERDNKIAKLEGILDRINKLKAHKSLAPGAGASSDEALNLSIQDVALMAEEELSNFDIEPTEIKGSFHYVQHVDSSSTGGCKSFALCPTSAIILLAQPNPQSTNRIFGGYGLRKYSTIDTNIREFIPLHSKMITSIQLKSHGDLILTAGQDKKVHLTSISNNTCIQSYQSQFEPTCVSWSAHRDQQFYVASGNCFVTLYDMRNTSEHIYQTSRRIANSRLISIASTTSPEDLNGLLVNDSKGCRWLELSDCSGYETETLDQSIEHLNCHELPFEGLMGTVDFNKRLNMALITTRRSNMSPNISHNLLRLRKTQDQNGSDKIECQTVRTFFGGRSENLLLSQSRILKHPTLDDQVLVGSCDEAARGLKLWDSSDNKEYQCLRSDKFIRDMIMYSPENSNQHVLYTLSESGLNVYKWDYA